MVSYDIADLPEARGLKHDDAVMLRRLVNVWTDRNARNAERRKYYEGKIAVKNLGIAIPEGFELANPTCDWAAKAVDMLQARSRFDGFVFADGEPNHNTEVIMRDNDLELKYRRAVISELIHGVVFATLSAGADDEPKCIINFHDAESASALWNERKNRIRCGMAVADTDYVGEGMEEIASVVNFYTDNAVIEITRDMDTLEWYVSRTMPHPMGRPLMEPMAYRPSQTKPLGRSRITNDVMGIVDDAMRTIMLMEYTSEMFAAPQKYILGATDEDFDKPMWETYIGNIITFGRDGETGETAQFGQLPQMSMEPLISMLRSHAARFAGSTGVPITSLGVIHDNPASYEAIKAGSEDLVIETQFLNLTNSRSLRNIALMAQAISRNVPLSALSEEEKDVTAHFKNPSMPSISSQSDAMVKLVSIMPGMAESDVTLEELGFDQATIRRIDSDIRKANSRAQAMAQMQQANGKTATMYEIKSIVQSYRAERVTRDDAIMLLAQIGFDEEQANNILNGKIDGSEVVEEASEGLNGNSNQTDDDRLRKKINARNIASQKGNPESFE